MKSDKTESQALSEGATFDVRKIRWGLRTKLFLGFTLLMVLYSLFSSTFLLQYLFQDKTRYILFSLHQSTESTCTRFSAAQYDASQAKQILRQNDSASGFIFDASTGAMLLENRLGAPEKAQESLSSASLWQVVKERSSDESLGNFTTEKSIEGRKYFISACLYAEPSSDSEASSVSEASSKKWLLYVVDAAEALQPAVGLLAKIGGLFAILLLAGFALAYGLARKLTEPLKSLTSLADDLGAGNYTGKLEVPGSDELGALADTFSILSQRLNAREAELEKSTELANQDFLTGLWNRRYLDRRLQEHFSLSKRHEHELSIIYMDADHFKRINDTYGHAAGDEVLKYFAKILTSQLRATDFVARVGGEEFVMVLPETALEGAVQAAEKLRQAIKAHEFLSGEKVKVTASLGVMSVGAGGTLKNAEELIEAADKMAYKSKTSGRDRITSPLGEIS